MYWVIGGTILLGMGVLLRRLLGLGTSIARLPSSVDLEHKSFCDAVSDEVKSRSEILAYLLNDAIGELKAGNCENASNVLDLVEAEWTSLAELLNAILQNVAEYLPVAHIVIPVRSMTPADFRSDVMIDYLRLHELVDQFLFRTKLRFHLQVRVLRHAVDILTADFRRAEAKKHLRPVFSRALWSRMDLDYHDFDLIAKRTILAFRKFVTWLPHSAAATLVLGLQPMLDRGVRSLIRY